jgi:hypothetical protein
VPALTWRVKVQEGEDAFKVMYKRNGMEWRDVNNNKGRG